MAATEQVLAVAAAVLRGETMEEILEGIFEHFHRVLPYDRIEYATIEDGGRTLLTRWVRTSYPDPVLAEGFRYQRSSGVGFDSDGPPYIETDTVEYAATRPPGHPSHLLLQEGIRSGLCLPLVLDGNRVGYLFFCSRRVAAYDRRHLWLLARVGELLAGGLRHSQLRAELAERNRQLEQLSQFRTRYLATISHELRTPLTGVVGLALTLRDRGSDLAAAERDELIRMLASESLDAAAIVEDLLVLARAEAGELVVSDERVDLVAEAWATCEALGVGVVVGEGWARGDRTRIRQVLRNLVGNAARYGGTRIDVRVEGSRAVVADDGEGVPPSHREAIFEPFHTAHADMRPAGSVGLGLWVSRQLAERMGGSLEYRYEEGESRFVLTLPPG